jgi:hypothetical protein
MSRSKIWLMDGARFVAAKLRHELHSANFRQSRAWTKNE